MPKCFDEHTSKRRKSGLLIDSVDAGLCKAGIDRIDCLLASHYGLTEEELDFIVSYDVKYRLGDDSDAGEA